MSALRRWLRTLPCALLAAALAAVAGCATGSGEGYHPLAKEYRSGLELMGQKRWHAAIDTLEALRKKAWSPYIDTNLARAHDALREVDHACRYWVALEREGSLERWAGAGRPTAASYHADVSRRARECWRGGRGVPWPALGPDDAPIVILEVSNFHSRYTAAHMPQVKKKLRTLYPGKLRFVWLTQLASFGDATRPAARAAVAAHLHGRFWGMHDLLLAYQRTLNAGRIAGFARDLGLDSTIFDADRAAKGTDAYLDRGLRIAAALGARRAPTYFVNGRRVRGEPGIDVFTRLIDLELRALASTKSPAEFAATRIRRANRTYAKLLLHDRRPVAAAARPAAVRRPSFDLDRIPRRRRCAVVPAFTPHSGTVGAPITLLEITGYGCPGCRRLSATVHEALSKGHAGVRHAVLPAPGPYDKAATRAALAVLLAEANRRGAQMHRALAGRRSHTAADIARAAGESGLQKTRFMAQMKLLAPVMLARLARNRRIAAVAGSPTPPALFINGRRVPADIPPQGLARVIAAAQKRAKRFRKPYRLLLARSCRRDLLGAKAAPSDVSGRPATGRPTSRHTVVIYADYANQVDREAVARLTRRPLLATRVVVKPIGRSAGSVRAARYAHASVSLGRFRRMNEALLRGQNTGKGKLDALAKQAAIDPARLRTALKAPGIATMIAADRKEAAALDVLSTPAVLLDGRIWRGPIDREAISTALTGLTP